ncbi:Predicted ATPase [Actinomyces ruminicola]|uniref:Predicted ATPase n=1 Tax=Actinomyces ruminicola TaxID=332524 RepID=A0A1H0A633_9ACTO|nr:BTAD domain-containing putative transcriptional regulator [Actinomyces ruminicola]SDN28433.1 Predicted ATPase [Actinomyces ruminicola]
MTRSDAAGAGLRLLDDAPSWNGEPLSGRVLDLLCVLAALPGARGGEDQLIAGLWDCSPPSRPRQALQVVVSRTRNRLGAEALQRHGEGYALTLPRSQVDHLDLVQRRRRAEAAACAHRPADVVDLTEGMGEISGAGVSPPHRRLLEQATALSARALRLRALALGELGRYAQAMELLPSLAEQNPSDEAVLAALIRSEAWTRSPAAALARYERYRRRLRQAGAVPGPLLRAAHEHALAAEHPVRQGLRAPIGLIGREHDLRVVEDAVATSQLVTITGPGGVGKTALAQALASRSPFPTIRVLSMTEVAPRGHDPVAADASDGAAPVDRLARELLAAIGRSGSAAQPARVALAQALAAPGTLLVLDDCEHVAGALADLLGPMLASLPGLHVVVTSRSVLELSAEYVHRLAPLTGTAAAALFRDRALAARPHQALDDDDLARLLPALEGLPLAIELAAARTRVMSVRQVAQRFPRDLRTMTGPRDLPERQRTLSAVIEWSWSLLDDPQRRALTRAALLADGFTLETAEAVIGPAAAVMLDQLAAQSLLTADGDDPPRFHMLSSVRALVRERVAGTLDAAEAQSAVRRWALGLARPVLAVMDGSRMDEVAPAVDALLAEERGVAAELGRALGDDDGHQAPEAALVLGAALLTAWSTSWGYSQTAAWVPRLLGHAVTAASDSVGNIARMLVLHRAVANSWLLGPLPEELRLRIPASFPCESAYVAAIRRLVRTRHEEWGGLLEDPDHWTAWAAGSCVVTELENRGDVTGALELNRSLRRRLRASDLPPVRLLELDVDGLRLLLEMGDYRGGLSECTRLLQVADRHPLQDALRSALRLQRDCCRVYLAPSPERAAALLADAESMPVPGMAMFITGFLGGEMELLRGCPEEAFTAARGLLERMAGADVPAGNPWELYGLATCLLIDVEIARSGAAAPDTRGDSLRDHALEATAMLRRGLQALTQALQQASATRFDLPTTASFACAVGLSAAQAADGGQWGDAGVPALVGEEPGDVDSARVVGLGLELFCAALACGPNQTSRLLSRPRLLEAARGIDPGRVDEMLRQAHSSDPEALVEHMVTLTGSLAELL